MSSKMYMSSTTATANGLGSMTGESFKVGEFERRLDALLADLQNSVPPGQQQQHHQQQTTSHYVNQQQNSKTIRNYGDSGSGYGSLRSKATVNPTNEPVQVHEQYLETRTTAGTLPTRTAYNDGVPHHQPSLNTGNNLSELDSLLHDLSSARYNGQSYEQQRRADFHDVHSTNGFHHQPSQPNSKYNTYNSYASLEENRPSVDTLLNEMDNASLYAVPNGVRGGRSPTPGRHVTITVRETKTENIPTNPGRVVESSEMQRQQRQQQTTTYASSATKELDDLMASLSDFKVNNGSNHHHQTITDYAKPNKGTSHLATQTSYSETSETTTSGPGGVVKASGTQTTTVLEESSRHIDQLDSMLGSLQANMNRQGVNTVQKGCCNACEKPIVGQVITALGKTWHPEHFTCHHCNQELGTRNFFERDGLPYCEPDYHNLFSPRCAYCNGAILDKCVTALEKTWHTEHFFCAQCGQQFGEDGFHERDGKPYCRHDYFEMFAPKCSGCNRAIMENYISALNSQWHPDCFVCRDCKKPVKGKSFYAMEGKPDCRQPFQGGSFFDHDGLPYCETHYHAKRGSLCAGCSKPITGRCITAMFRKFHPEHFVCAFCLKQLNKGTFKEQNDKPYCHTCFDKIFG